MHARINPTLNICDVDILCVGEPDLKRGRCLIHFDRSVLVHTGVCLLCFSFRLSVLHTSVSCMLSPCDAEKQDRDSISRTVRRASNTHACCQHSFSRCVSLFGNVKCLPLRTVCLFCLSLELGSTASMRYAANNLLKKQWEKGKGPESLCGVMCV